MPHPKPPPAALPTQRSAPTAASGQTFAMRHGQHVRTPPVYHPNASTTTRVAQAKMRPAQPPVRPTTIQPMKDLRGTPTASMKHVLSQTHNAVDFMSFRTLSDLWWYKRAAEREKSKKFNSAGPMAGHRILAGGAAAVATRLAIGGAATVGVLAAAPVLSTITGGTAIAVGVASLARAAVTSLQDKAAGYLADENGDDSGWGRKLWNKAYGEKILTTGWKLVARGAKRKDAGGVMGGSASAMSGNTPYVSGKQDHAEWLHMLGRQLGGASAQDNFVAGTAFANTEMIPIENAARAAADRGETVYYKVTVFVDAETRNANRVNVRVNFGTVDRINYNIDAQRSSFSKMEYAALEKFANAMLGN